MSEKTTAVDDARTEQDEVCMPDYDPDHHINEICAEMCLQFDEEGLKRFDKDPAFQWLLRRAGESEKKLALLPADWHVESSLETWFPFSAKDLADSKAKVADLEAQLRTAISTIQERDEHVAGLVVKLEQLEAQLRQEREAHARTKEILSEAQMNASDCWLATEKALAQVAQLQATIDQLQPK